MQKNSTKSELKVLEILQNLTCATAEEIYHKINTETKDKKIGLTSVYRALKKLEKNYEVKCVNLFNDGKIRYELNKNEGHHHHFICKKCNYVEIIHECPLKEIEKTLKSKHMLLYHSFDLYGICNECLEKQT